MKLESLVIADEHAAVNLSLIFVHTARHTLGIGFPQVVERRLGRSSKPGAHRLLEERAAFFDWLRR
jgi:hypothetical protein